NTVREVRTFVAGDAGPGRATQVARFTGAFEAENRAWIRAVGGKLEKRFARRAEQLFNGTLERATSSDPDDLTRPLELTLAVKDARRIFAGRHEVEVIVYPHAALDGLPWALSDAPDVPRTSDFVWPRPQIYEVEHRIVLPDGFAPPAPAAER